MDQEKEGLGKRQILPLEVSCSLLLDRPKVMVWGKPEHHLLPDPASGLKERERVR